MKNTIFLLLFFSCLSVSAVEVSTCKKSGTEMIDILTPFKKYVRTFSGDKINIVLVDRTEPAACSYYLVIVIDDRKSVPQGGRRCYAVGCFGNVHFQTIKSSYNTAKGLLLHVPVQFYNGLDGNGKTKITKVRINLNNVSVKIEK